jgi:protocatechuate 3,4-dioxygenase beta subunit
MSIVHFSTRRSFLWQVAAGTAGLWLPAKRIFASGACALDRELTEGPYYLDRGIQRRNITEGKAGVPLHLRLTVIDARTCEPLENAALEIWHCDAGGVYSGYTKMGGGPPGMMPRERRLDEPPPGPPPGGPPPEFDQSGRIPFGRHHPTDDTAFCRGVQLSDKRGAIEFETIYPGWYVGRDIHIHLKVHVNGSIEKDKYAGGHVSHTGQLFFPDELSDEISNLKPYGERKNIARTRIDEDMVVADAHGSPVMLSFEQMKRDSLEAGMIGTAVVRVDPSASQEEHRRWSAG